LRVGAGWVRSCSRKKATPPPSPLPATVAAAPLLLRRPQIEVLLFHLASPSPAHHPFLFLDGSLAPFLFLQDAKICGGGDVGTAGSPDLWPLASPSSRLPTRRSVPRVVAPAGGGGGGERVVAPLLSSAHCSAVRNSLLLPDSPIFLRARPGRSRLAGSRSGGAWCSRRSYHHPPLAPIDWYVSRCLSLCFCIRAAR